MILASILIAWAVLGLVAIVGFGILMASWNRIADDMHKADPTVRDAIGWPHRNLALVHIVWPSEGFRMWRAQVRTCLYGLPNSDRIPAETRTEARRYRRLTWLFSAPFFLPVLALSLLAIEFLLFVVCVPLVMVLIAGRWPSAEEIERRMAE